MQLLSGTDNDELTPPTVSHKTLIPNKNSRALIGDFLGKKIGLKKKKALILNEAHSVSVYTWLCLNL